MCQLLFLQQRDRVCLLKRTRAGLVLHLRLYIEKHEAGSHKQALNTKDIFLQRQFFHTHFNFGNNCFGDVMNYLILK